MVESDLSDDNNDSRSTTPATGNTQRVLLPAQNRVTPLEIDSNASISATITRTIQSERKTVSTCLFNSSNDDDDEDDGVIDLCGSDTDSIKKNGDTLASKENRSMEQTPFTAIDNDSFDRDRKGGRDRIKTNRYCDEFAGVTVEDKESDIDDKKDTDSVALNLYLSDNLSDDPSDEEEAEEEWAPAKSTNDACWAREAALYDSNREESSSEDDEFSDDDSVDIDGLEQGSQQRKAGRKERRTSAARQKNGRRPRPVKNNVEVLPRLSSLKIQAEFEKIQNFSRDDGNDGNDEDEEDGRGVKLAYSFLVCIMWDFDFRYTLMHHQYKGVLMVAGIDTNALCRRFAVYSNEEKNKLLNLDGDGRTFRRNICTTVRFVATKGMLLGDDMVSDDSSFWLDFLPLGYIY